MTWVQIIETWLKENGYNCLVDESNGCHCVIGNLFDCAIDAFTFENYVPEKL
jgi:hypothetical protein